MKSRQIYIYLITLIILSSCSGYRQYTIPEKTLALQKINGHEKIKLEDIKTNISGLKESNIGYLSIKINSYLSFKRKHKDSSQIKQSFIQFFKRAPSTVTEASIKFNINALKKYYRLNGFLKANIFSKVDTLKTNPHLLQVTYFIEEGPLSTFSKSDTVLVNNPIIENHVRTYISNQSLLKKNAPLESSLLKSEKEKLSNYFKNIGYYYFSPEVIGLKLDDIKDSSLLKVGMVYQIPDSKIVSTNRYHDRLFRIGPIDFRENEYLSENSEGSINKISPATKALKSLILIKDGDLFSANKFSYSLQNIYETDQFKSVSIQYDTNSTTIFPKIELIRNDKFNLTSELGGSAFRGIPGPFISNSFKIRRVFGQLDYLDFTTRIGFEAQSGFINTDFTRKNLEINLATTINFPVLFLPTLLKNRLGDYFGAKTVLGLGYDYIDRPEYNRTNFRIFERYIWKKTSLDFFQLSFLDLNIINTNYPQSETSSLFVNYLNDLRIKGNNLYRSFNPSFVSSINFTYTHRTFIPTNELISGRALTVGIESGGTTLNFFNNNKIKFIETFLGENSDMQFYRFLRFNFDYRNYKILGVNKKSQLAFKFIGGIAYAYGPENDYQLPYEKNFFIGGPSSIRAWKPRRLGPGSYYSGTNLIEQPGSVLLESSIEYRFKIIKVLGDLHGAFFIDTGNIWSLQENKNESTVFRVSNFINEIAVGTGFGLRWDFNYFLLRLDMATKVINPANPINRKWVISETTFRSGENPIEFNIGIGYPF